MQRFKYHNGRQFLLHMLKYREFRHLDKNKVLAAYNKDSPWGRGPRLAMCWLVTKFGSRCVVCSKEVGHRITDSIRRGSVRSPLLLSLSTPFIYCDDFEIYSNRYYLPNPLCSDCVYSIRGFQVQAKIKNKDDFVELCDASTEWLARRIRHINREREKKNG